MQTAQTPAEESLGHGDVDDALRMAESAPSDDQRAARVAAVAHGAHGRWPQAIERALAADDPHLANLAGALSGAPVSAPASVATDAVGAAARGMASAVAALQAGRDPIPDALAAAALLDGRDDAQIFESPHVMVSMWAAEMLEANAMALRTARRGVEEQPGGALLAGRHHLALAWVTIVGGTWDQTPEERANGKPVAARDALLAAAIDAAAALRVGEVDALGRRLDDALSALDRCGADAVTVSAVAEVVAVAVRLDRSDDVRRARDAAERILDALGRPPLLVWALAWRLVRAGGLLGDAVVVGEACKAMEESGPPSDKSECLLHAAHTWLAIAEGSVDPEAVFAASRRLEDAGLRWEAALLLGSAGVRTDDPAAARSLLSKAREIRRILPELHAARGEVAGSLLTFRERDVAALVVDGLTHKEIGARLHVSAKTVEHHVARIRQKLGASTRAEMLSGLREILP
ncbi:MAG TPA: helix-turn-helix transcriptional regulator [Acidimicrobiia bacterium]|nr:helix-turn-helix transcriptional regulator [Acidimicrobiia bacterium]